MLDRLSESTGIGVEWLLTIGFGLVLLVLYLVAGDGVSDLKNVAAGTFKSEDVGARLRRECESIIREAWPNLSGTSQEIRVRLCIDERGRSGK